MFLDILLLISNSILLWWEGIVIFSFFKFMETYFMAKFVVCIREYIMGSPKKMSIFQLVNILF